MLPPGPRGTVAQQTLAWLIRPGAFMTRCRERYGDTFSVKLLNEGTFVFTSDPEQVRSIFTGDPDVLHGGEAKDVLGAVLGPSSLLRLDGERHLRQRRLITPAFHGERMHAYLDLMTEVIRSDVSSWPQGRPFRLYEHMQSITLDIILRALFGLGAGEDRRLAELRSALLGLLDWVTQPRLLFLLVLAGPERAKRWSAFRRTQERVHRMLTEEIHRRRADETPGHDVLSALVHARDEHGDALADDELRDELMTLLLAGHETTAGSLAWAFERLVRNPEVLERATDAARDSDGEYLEAVAKETLRLRSVTPVLVRRLTRPMQLGEWTLPAGVHVAPCSFLLHRREDLYPDPLSFRPERWVGTKPGTYTWLPFGGGTRRCPGAAFGLQEMRVTLETVLRHVSLRAADQAPERIGRRLLFLTPARGATVIADRVDRFEKVRSPEVLAIRGARG
jgi:cytochrome P450 family 135